MKRFYIHNRGVNFNCRLKDVTFYSDLFGENWRCQSEWYVRIAIEPKWFDLFSIYYDGHTLMSITVFGLQLGIGYIYDSRPVTKWEAA